MNWKTVIAVVVAAWLAAPVGAEPAPSQDAIFPLNRVQPGMRGRVYTVMQGSEVVTLDAEIYGVLHSFIGPKKDLIVGKLVDERTKLTGAVHGMSGSPLYIEGRVAGALSYRLTQFEKEGWCGFTPIADMIEAGESSRAPGQKPVRLHSSVSGPRIADASGAAMLPAAGGFDARLPFLPADAGGFRPLAVPVTVGGLSPRMFEWLRSEFAAHGFGDRLLPVAGGGGDEDKALNTPFEPGAPVAGVLAAGDIHMAGTGTLTWRRGNRVLAFGHPFFQNGTLAMPMARAEIVATVSSYLMPHKISNTRQIVGTIYEDRLTAIAGEIGPTPPMSDMSVRVHGPRGERKFQSRLYMHEDLMPTIAAACVGQVLTDTMDYSREFSLTLRGEIRLKNHEPVRMQNFYSGGDTSDHLVAMHDLGRVLTELLSNRFERAQIERVAVELKLDEQRHTMRMGDVYLDRDKAKPGERVKLRAVLLPWRGERRVATLEFTVPDNVRSGDLDILVGDASAADALDGRSGQSRLEHPQNLDQLVSLLNQRRTQNALYLRVTRKADGIIVADQRMPALPLSAMQLYDSSRTMLEATRLERADVAEQRLPQDGVVRGSQTLKLKIE